ncbi:MAG TPA: hypothetical protein VJS44_18160 [Pyrinomonadaceae bacterium]|nr:hypothetical protein [Pyrinomonadaceae bacterium]
MTPEERFARLEQNHDILVQLLIETRELNERAQAQLDRVDARTESLEEQTKILIELARDHDERLNTQLSWINKLGDAQASMKAEMAELTKAQTKAQEAQAYADSRIAALADAQAGTVKALGDSDLKIAKIDKEIAKSNVNLVAIFESHLRMEASYRKTEETMSKLAESRLENEQKFKELMARFKTREDEET